MKNLIFALLMVSHLSCASQNDTNADSNITYHINHNVKNSDAEYFQEIQTNWEEYLNSRYFVKTDHPLWNHDEFSYPDYSYVNLLIDLSRLTRQDRHFQCSTIGIVPVEKDFYLLKTIFTEKEEEMVDIKYIISVYAKRIDGNFQFFSSTHYSKETCMNKQFGKINYIIHPDHSFQKVQAEKMESFNKEMAELFKNEVLAFDYVVANDTRDLSEMMGVNLFSYSYQPVASGGMADNYNRTIFAGNNSAYYPHEVVHLYTYAKFNGQYHPWVDEGIAALLGGSTGYDIEWHWEKLRRFIKANPDYELKDLSALETNIPNGEFMSDFRYAIGALICQKIIDKKGMDGIFEALQFGKTEENYFEMLEHMLGVNKDSFETFVKSEISKLPPISDDKLEDYRY